MDLVALLVLNGLAWGLIVALIALGLSIIFGLLEFVNIAHGDFFMIGAVLAWYVIDQTGNFWIAFVLVPAIGLIAGCLTERILLKPVENDAQLSIVAAFAISLVLQEVARATFGSTPKRIVDPIGITAPLLGIDYDVYRIFAAGVSLIALAAFFVFLHKTKFGTWMRAVRQNREIAVAMGIPSDRIFMVTFGIGTALAMLAGVVAAPLTTVDFRLGLNVLPLCFIAVIVGGLGNLPGTAAAAVLISVVEGFITSFTEPTTARIVSLVFMSVVLIVRPQGIFARAR